MGNRLTLKSLGLLITFMVLTANTWAGGREGCDQICGKWISEQKNFIVQVYKDGDNFKASVVWFDDSDDPSKPMETRVDDKNPDKSLRSRRLIGMNVLRDLTYHADTNSWEDGIIYDAKNGREWNSSAQILKDGTLKVTGYWHFKFIGKSIKFNRVTANDILLTKR
ncbi:DUF2147 domain-containing protein [Mucilaginibacter sp. KACC 22063]|uniref:DUF2147 domain-containing protein n=1 Tax=Mucilaginibacter sp. KACC 22063 TaxID=3025666 RepID=UPI0023664230|nr:DUF2147 domain-containing protein [Mucilaginibacter sp. KACC 22063]WDF54640.1 DUF2147 domain-containing protein [Mucilaginibacter sp. KACC 22063]